MRIRRLEMNSFRGIKHLELDFPDANTAVFVGINGAGKTSILEIIYLMAQNFGQRWAKPIPIFTIQDSDILHGSDHASGKMEIDIGKEKHAIKIFKEKEERQLLYLQNKQISEGDAIDKFFYKTLSTKLRFYPVNRSVIDVTLDIDQEETDQPAINSRRIEFSEFFKLFRIKEDEENEKRLNVNALYRNESLEAFRKALHKILPEFKDIRIKRSPAPQMIIFKDDVEFQINQLSDGEKGLIALIGDIALQVVHPGAGDELKDKGIVLIDEIELHLHPKWQRLIIPRLEAAFPNIQFIVTTHSPQVLSNVKPESIFLLEQTDHGIEVYKPSVSYGRDSNQILTRIMDVSERPIITQEKLDMYFDLLNQKKLDKAKLLRKELESDIGEDDPVFAKADIIIRRIEILGK